jgi:GTP-binding protein
VSAPLRFSFVQSASAPGQLPPTRAEVAFLGRSNVGKSSLLNALANHRRLAHVSKTPGRTQLLNLFELGDHTTAVDLPGYGFAAVPGKTRAQWQPMVEGYLLDRPNLVMILVLVDGEIGPTKLDVQMLEWLRYHDRPVTVVASKLDKVKSSRRGVRRREVAEGAGVGIDDVVWVSAAKGTGIEDLRGRIHGWLRDGAEAWKRANPDGSGRNDVATSASSGRGDDGAAASKNSKNGFVPVQQNPDGSWPDEDEW